MIRKLAHLCFVTDDANAMVDFYTEKLGLTVKFTMELADSRTFGWYIDCGDSTFIEIFDQALKVKQWGGEVEELRSGNRYQHFSLEVTGLRDLKADLEARGVKVSDVSEGMDHSLQAWMRDPDGNSVELMEYTHRSRQIAG